MKIVEDKLDRFEGNLIADVEAEKKQILESANKKNFERFDKKETEILTTAYNTIQAGLKKIDKQRHEFISKAIMENKTLLLNKRAEVIDAVFQRAIQKINDFVKSEAYKQYLVDMIQENIQSIGDGELVIYINDQDSQYLDELNELFNNRVVLEKKNVELIGGCKILNQTKRLFLDDSFTKRIEDQKAIFLQTCKIQIDESVD